MRAVRCHELTGPSSLRVDEIPDPTPDAGHVVIDVRAAGVNFPDLLLSYGKYQFKPAPPFTPGAEASGVVSAVGEGVRAVAIGDRVAATVIHGAFAEKLVAPQDACIKLPSEVDFEAAAATMITYATGYHALVDRAAIKSDETLLVLGAAGGVGIAAIQLGKLLGARVIAAASSEAKLAVCREAGADATIDYSKDDLKERTKTLTGGDGANVIYDPVGGAKSEAALRAIAWEGRYLVIGFASGDIPKIPLNLTLLKGCQIAGVFWGAFAMRDPAKNRRNAARIFAWIAEKKLTPRIEAVLPFERAKDALERLERREVKGKIVLVSPTSFNA